MPVLASRYLLITAPFFQSNSIADVKSVARSNANHDATVLAATVGVTVAW